VKLADVFLEPEPRLMDGAHSRSPRALVAVGVRLPGLDRKRLARRELSPVARDEQLEVALLEREHLALTWMDMGRWRGAVGLGGEDDLRGIALRVGR
jgi:hypothetical protein